MPEAQTVSVLPALLSLSQPPSLPGDLFAEIKSDTAGWHTERRPKAKSHCRVRLRFQQIENQSHSKPIGTDSMAHSVSESATDIQYRIDRNEGAFSYGSTDCEGTNAQRATDTIAGNDFREVYQDKSAHCRIESNRRSMHRSYDGVGPRINLS